MRLLPELHTTNCLVKEMQYQSKQFKIEWTSQGCWLFVGQLQLRPMFESVKIWLNGIGVGCYKLECGGEFLPHSVKLLIAASEVK